MCSASKWCFTWHGTWSSLVHSDCWPIPGPVVLFQHQSLVRTFIFWNIVFKWLAPNFFIFLAQSVVESVQRSRGFLCSSPLCCRCFYQAIISLFFSSKERKGKEECENIILWCYLVCWICSADVKSCHVFPFWAIFGTLVVTWDHHHYKKMAYISLS